MNKSENAVKKPHKVGRILGRILGILILILAVLIAVLSIRHHILSKRDREIYADAYGEYYTTEQGRKMNYTRIESDAKDVAVILPGYGCPTVRYEFDAFVKGLSNQYQFIIVEPLGYGLSDGAVSERNVTNYCEELHGLLTSLQCDKYTLIAHSLGGLYSLYYANQYPDEVQGFIGIDASVPHQCDADQWIAKPEHTYLLYKIMRPLLYGSGINRLLSELSFEQTAAQIPTLSEDDKRIAKAIYCAAGINDTLMDEMRMLADNMCECYDMKFPESVPVLYVLAKDNTVTIPEWEQYHKDLVTHPDSRVTVIEGAHYLHFTSLQRLTDEITDWHNR